VKFTVKK